MSHVNPMNAQLEEIIENRPSAPLAHDADYDSATDAQFDEDQELIFRRTLASSATLSVVLALVSFTTFLDTMYLFLPIVTVLVAIAAISKIRKYPDEIYGIGIAKGAIAIGVFCFVASLGWHSYVYATEVPEGYTRLEFRELQEDERHPDAHLKTWQRMDGKKVFIQGYMFPADQKDGITSFILCRDKGDCCFGGKPKITERISVTLNKDDPGIPLSTSLQKLTGTFRFEHTYSGDAIGKGEIVLFHLDDGVKR
jgi:hypothetical protein